MSRHFIIAILSFAASIAAAQSPYRIYELPQTAKAVAVAALQSAQQSVASRRIATTGVVTFVQQPEAGRYTFFIQDAVGDGDASTSDAVVCYAYDQAPTVGDELHLTAILRHDGQQRYLDSVVVVQTLAGQRVVAATPVRFPDDFADYSALLGMTLSFDRPLYVTSNYNLERYGQLTLSSQRLRAVTDTVLPGSADYAAVVAGNAIDQIILDDGSTTTYPSPMPFLDSDGTRRTGSSITNLTAVLNYTSNRYMLYPLGAPEFGGNWRPDYLPIPNGSNLVVCGFNLQYYLASNYGTGYGPDNETLAARQHVKILHALRMIDADIYGLVEVQTGQGALSKLCDALNEVTSPNRYAFINDGSSTNGTYTKSGYIYRSDRVTPYNGMKSNNTVVQNRKKAQGFRLLSNGETFIFALNHFKSKSGTGSGSDADQGDGQGAFNASRVTEANSVISAAPVYEAFYNDPDILIMGDLNAYAKEDPIRAFEAAGYINLLATQGGNDGYSYSYQSQVGYLDHAIANRSMAQQVLGASAFHINTDEPVFIGYSSTNWQNNMFRSSDHDPIIVSLKLGTYTDSLYPTVDNGLTVLYNDANPDIFTVLNAKNQWMTVADLAGRSLGRVFIRSDETTFTTAQFHLTRGIYLLSFDDLRSARPTTRHLRIMR